MPHGPCQLVRSVSEVWGGGMGVVCSQRDLREVTVGAGNGLLPMSSEDPFGLGCLRAPYCLCVAIFAFCCNRGEQWRTQRPVARLQNRSPLSAVAIAEQKTMCGDCGYRKWSSMAAFTSRLF